MTTTRPPSPLAGYVSILTTVVVFALGSWASSSGLLDTIASYQSDIVYLLGQHVLLVAYSSAIAIAVGLPIGVALTRKPLVYYADAITQVINLGTTIPTLAVLALAMSFLGIGAPSAVFALTILTLLPIVLNTIAGLSMVPRHLIEAATGMGMTGRQILFRVELPNALFVILAGVRTAIAINVGTAPLAFLVGGGGLGELIFTGIDLMDPSLLLAGAIPTAALAIFADFMIGQCQYWLIPKGVNPLR
ncbi:ABC transporter permease [Agrobacterium tumefaciens]|uniref:ABC transporter permease n=1 Tax=Agrobacterium tumefaciens TaxID=358 RepID=UPI001572762A|nr:ABC transporter permease [Agrobacterium tumefaciens]NTB97246.1 ABC transporter permease [Agrobacterium tumefaciens]NTC43419.1 ABC transporter permease [Agrobacterium tumefaciens]